MKKCTLLIVLCVLLCLAACGKTAPVPVPATAPAATAAVTETTEIATMAQTQPAETETVCVATEAETEPPTAPVLGNGLRPEFQAAMDSYEAFIDEYIAFMAKNYVDPATFSAECADMMARYTQETEAFYRWDAENMSEAEYAYNMEVQTRVHQKLMDAGLEG